MMRFCLNCGADNAEDARICRSCGRILEVTPRQRREGAAFMLNELESLKLDATLPLYLYRRLRRRYLSELAPAREEAVPAPLPSSLAARPSIAPTHHARAIEEPWARVPEITWGFLAEQQANLLLYLGAFLIVIAALILVGYSEGAIGGGVKMGLLVVYTLLFLAVGTVCMRFPRVRQAGLVFFAVGALMVPLNFVGAYVFFADEDMDPTGLWLGGSLASAFFYAAVSMLVISRWYTVPCAVAIEIAFLTTLILADVPAQAWPVGFVALAVVLVAPGRLRLGRISEVFGTTAQWASNATVPLGVFLACWQAYADEVLDLRLWLNISLVAVAFYAAGSMLWAGRVYAAISIAAALSSLGAVLAVSNAPVEAYPPCFVSLALIVSSPSILSLGRISDVFGETGRVAAHLLVPVAGLAALQMTGFDMDALFYLPITSSLATLFYATQALWASRKRQEFEPPLTVVALSVAGATGVSLVYALDLGREWYGPAVAIVAWLYAAATESFGPRWFGQRYLPWMALATITIAWLPFEGLYDEFPRHGAGVHFAAVALYLIAARLIKFEISLSDPTDASGDARVYRLPLSILLVYAAGLALFGGFFHLLSSLPAAETAGQSDLAWPYFGLSLSIATIAATTRWWWPQMRPHLYVIAVAISLFVLLSSLEQEGSLTLALGLYTGLSVLFVYWEREALSLSIPAVYGFFAVLAAWRYYDPPDAYLPLTLSGIGCTLVTVTALLRSKYGEWALSTLVLGLAYAIVAPAAGWWRLDLLADSDGFVGTEHFEETLLYQTSAASVFLLALLLAALSWSFRRLEIAATATSLMMIALLLEIGHFNPDNVQFYTLPLGTYLVAAALLSTRIAPLPADLRSLLGPLEAFGAVLIMAPSLMQSFDEDAWGYGIALLGEGLLLVAIAIMRRRLWLLGSAISFTVLDGLHYLFFAGGPALPSWAMLAIVGTAVMAAGTAILFGREHWTRWQRWLEAWWYREAIRPAAAGD